jgi:pimeloyl-ACP methyl ester carboxylesterase
MGEPSHPAVVLLHGYGGNSSTWWAMGHSHRLVGLGFFVVALDLRGHGASAKPTTSAGWQNDAEMRDIMTLTHDELQLTHYLAVSQSHGSIELAKLLTVDDRLVAAVLGEYGDGMTSAAHRQSWWYDTLAAQKEAEAETAGTEEERTSALALAQLQRHQAITSPEEMARVAVPVLVIHGSEDYYNGASCRGPTGQNAISAQSDFATLAGHFRYGELAVVPGGHGAASNTPEFAQHVDAFLLTHKPPTSTLRLPRIFSDQMILQRGKQLAVWGWAAPGSGVTVSLGACQACTVASAADGQWSLQLPAQKENSEGQELTVTGDNGDELVLHDVLIGEVWLCSGASVTGCYPNALSEECVTGCLYAQVSRICSGRWTRPSIR